MTSRTANIVHFGKYYPPDEGGIETVTATLARGAAAAGYRVDAVCFAGLSVADTDDAGVHVRRLPQRIRMNSQPLGWAYLREAVSLGRRADIVHVHTPNMLAAVAALCIGRRPRIVVHWHSDVVAKGLAGMLVRPLEAALLRRADRIICTSKAYAEGSRPLAGHAARIATVPIGVADPPQFVGGVAAARAQWPAPIRDFAAHRPTVLAVGRLVPYKGYATLIDAAARMRSGAALVVVGAGPLAEDLRERIQRVDVADRVLLAGRVDDPTLVALRAGADIFCMPSVERSEAFGVALVEAMACGLPLVATRIKGSGVPWVNLDGASGLNVEPGDAAGLAEALDRLVVQPGERARLAAGARQRYLECFTEQRSVDSMLTVYRDLLATSIPAS
jgi:glycosyltransferase involved in cell wall biosynthesis